MSELDPYKESNDGSEEVLTVSLTGMYLLLIVRSCGNRWYLIENLDLAMHADKLFFLLFLRGHTKKPRCMSGTKPSYNYLSYVIRIKIICLDLRIYNAGCTVA